jgi:hypothetical protein
VDLCSLLYLCIKKFQKSWRKFFTSFLLSSNPKMLNHPYQLLPPKGLKNGAYILKPSDDRVGTPPSPLYTPYLLPDWFPHDLNYHTIIVPYFYCLFLLFNRFYVHSCYCPLVHSFAIPSVVTVLTLHW